MGERTAITWAFGTFNPWTGCWKISPGCKFCYAAESDHRWNPEDGHWERTGPRQFRTEEYWRQPAKWDRAAKLAGERRRIFCASQSDVFEDRPDLVPHRIRLWSTIRATPNLDWLLLSKRPENMRRLLPWTSTDAELREAMTAAGVPLDGEPWGNVWLGVTTEDQEHLDRRLRIMLGDMFEPAIQAACYFASYEPAIGPVTFARGERNWLRGFHRGEILGDGQECLVNVAALNWIVAGDESGRQARPAKLDWMRAVRDECDAHGTAWHFKQWCGPDEPGIGGTRVKGKYHLPILDGEVRDGAPVVTR